MMQRHRFSIKTDTGVAGDVTHGDTGPSFFGEIMQMRWSPQDTGVADTGGDLQVGLYPELPGDTGLGFLIVDETDVMGLGFTRAPRQPGHAPDGTDTGVDEYFPYVAAGDRLRVKVTAGRTLADSGQTDGTLYVWTRQ